MSPKTQIQCMILSVCVFSFVSGLLIADIRRGGDVGELNAPSQAVHVATSPLPKPRYHTERADDHSGPFHVYRVTDLVTGKVYVVARYLDVNSDAMTTLDQLEPGIIVPIKP